MADLGWDACAGPGVLGSCDPGESGRAVVLTHASLRLRCAHERLSGAPRIASPRTEEGTWGCHLTQFEHSADQGSEAQGTDGTWEPEAEPESARGYLKP